MAIVLVFDPKAVARVFCIPSRFRKFGRTGEKEFPYLPLSDPVRQLLGLRRRHHIGWAGWALARLRSSAVTE